MPTRRRRQRPPVRLRDLSKYPRVKGDDYDEYGFTPDEEIREMQRCKASIPYFIEHYCVVRHPEDGLVPFILYGYQKDKVLPAMVHLKQFVTRKFRQGGFTTLAAIYVLWVLLFECDREILVISKTDREAMKVLKVVLEAFDHLPEFLRCKYYIRNAHVFHTETGSVVQCYTPNAGASFSASILLIDEAAKVDKMDERWADIYPVISAGVNTRCWVISTCNGVVGKGAWYYQCWTGAINNQSNGFTPIDVSHTEHPLYCQEWWLKKQEASLGPIRFRQEVLREFIAAGNSVFRDETVQQIETRAFARAKPLRVMPCPLLPRDSPHKNMIIWENPEPGVEYIVSCDVAEGLGTNDPSGAKHDMADFSAIQVLRLSDLAQMAEYRNDAIKPQDLAKVVQALAILYNNAAVVCEASAIGLSMTHHLLDVLQYDNIFCSRNDKLGLIISSRNRTIIYTGAVNMLEKGLTSLRSTRTASELRTLVFNPQTKRIDHLRGYHDDLFTALAYGYYAREHLIASQPPGASVDYKPIYTYSIEESDTIMRRLVGADGMADEDDDMLLPSTTGSTGVVAEHPVPEEIAEEDDTSNDRKAFAKMGLSMSTRDDMDNWGTR